MAILCGFVNCSLLLMGKRAPAQNCHCRRACRYITFTYPSSLLLFWLPRWLSDKESACQCKRCRRCGFNPWVGKIPWRRKWQPTPALLPRKSHRQWSLVGYSFGVAKSQTWLSNWACTQTLVFIKYPSVPGMVLQRGTR